jgi:hypothetical protein
MKGTGRVACIGFIRKRFRPHKPFWFETLKRRENSGEQVVDGIIKIDKDVCIEFLCRMIGFRGRLLPIVCSFLTTFLAVETT